MSREMDCEFEGKLKGPLVSAPEFDKTQKGQPRCRLVFPKKCTGKGEINDKPYWVQVVVFGDLADQAKNIPVGSTVVVECGLNANRWYAKDGVTIKTSSNYIAHKIGVVKSLTDPPEWLPGAPKKAKAAKAGVDGHEEVDGEEPDDAEVEKFLHRQGATSGPGKDAAAAGAGAEVQGAGVGAGSVPGGGGH